MKILHLLLGAFMSLIMVHFMNAQTAAGGCNSVTVTDGGGGYDADLFFSSCFTSVVTPCEEVTTGVCTAVVRQYQLERLNGSAWVVVRPFQISDNFQNVTTHGTYRVAVRTPVKKFFPGCDIDGFRRLTNISGQLLGFKGEWSVTSYSSQVVVGATIQSDMSWTFIDANNNSLFNTGEQVRMNTANSKNYENWWLAIFENGGQNRYWTNGWTEGQAPSEINLNETVDGAFADAGNAFAQIPVSYTVQFAISSNCNTSWVNLDRNFSVCPANLGCRIADQEHIALSPNPANSTFLLSNMDTQQPHRVVITDMSGKTIKSFGDVTQQEYDIADINSGLYIVTVWDKDEKVYTNKLSILK
jgi:Secretion system C-terminal sorting domain